MSSTRGLVLFTIVWITTGLGCKRSKDHPGKQPAAEAKPATAGFASIAAELGSCVDSSTTAQLAPGLELLTLVPSILPAIPSPDRCLRVLRADMADYRVVVGAQATSGAALTGPDWARQERAFGVINASMFHQGGDSTGLLVSRGNVLAKPVNQKFGAFFATDPRHGGEQVQLWGRGCGSTTLASLRKDYSTIVQNYRLFSCDGAPIAWKDEKVYSAAAVGLDRKGRVLFIHSRAPYKMSEFTKLLSDRKLGLDLAAAMYVEGGPEATLYARVGERSALFVGSYESEFLENHDNEKPWPLPNVLMLTRRER